MTNDQFQKIIKKRARKDTSESFKYFWAAFVFHIVLYAIFTHFFIKHFGNTLMMTACGLGTLAYIPFTVVLIKKFKSLAVLKDASIQSYIQKQYDLLDGFYRFKKRYEIILIPVLNLVGTYLVFEFTVPGSVMESPLAAATVYVASTIIMFATWKWENEKSFDIPLSKLRLILKDLES